MPTDVTIRDFHTVIDDGARILLRWYTKDGAGPVRLLCTCTVAG